ncbi:MAG: VWA domain-containing protein [Verrucomicrobia bacterium]|nr:VWA domain-containing protein [Verrucomicrobiota bacterium]
MNANKTNWRKTVPGILAALALAAITCPTPTHAAGLLIADGGFGGVLEIKEHDVAVTINNGIAVTKVTQVFHNTEQRQVEALYTFPVPKRASVANFSMWINGKEMVGEVLERQRARQIYDSYKQQRIDPGLLEQVDYRTFEMRIFPIGPGADQKVEITYYQELDYDNDVATYVYPLATVSRKDVDSRTTGEFAIGFDIKSAVPIVELESPSHGNAFAIAKHSEVYWQANLESTSGSLAQDVVLACKISRPKTGMDLITSRRSGEDGFFCLSVTVGEDVAQRQDGMDYVFVLDASGSMADSGKLLLSKDAVHAFLNELGDADRFEVMTFNVTPNLAFGQLQAGAAANKQRALDYLSTQQAQGGTVLQPAMTTAYKFASNDRPLNVVILSDGLTEQQERAVLLQQIQKRPGNTRVFCIGVGNDVNRPLLEQLAEDSGGLAAFISPGDNFTRQARAFRQKLMRPFATNLELKFAGVDVTEVEPAVMPNLYHGAPVRVYGRYRGSGTAEVTLRGSVNGVEVKQTARLDFPKTDAVNPEINRMWAWHRVNRLLKDADRKGDRSSVIPEIVRLGEDFSIVTEYTSFLVLENDAEYQRWKIARRNLESTGRDRQAHAKLREQLDSIRNKALANLGPQAVESNTPVRPVQLASASPAVTQPARQPAAQTQTPPPLDRRQSSDFRLPATGTSPVGPLGVLLAAWLLRRKRKVS